MTDTSFQLYKTVAVVLTFAVAALLQWCSPLVRARGATLRNWKANLPLALVNVVLMTTLCGGCACAIANFAEAHDFGVLSTLKLPLSGRIIFAVVTLDLVAYAWHRANHRLPLLWRFHSVHHSDEVYDVSTAVRFHPGEVLISLGVRLAVVGLLGLPVLGILIFEILYAFSNFIEHGNIKLPSVVSQSVGHVFVTPALHRLHHSRTRDELNSNFGTILSLWDRLFRTLRHADANAILEVGLPEKVSYAFRPLTLLRHPFRFGN